MQCSNPSCQTQVASAEDLLAHAYGDHMVAAQLVAKKFNQQADFSSAKRRKMERAVLDAWVGFCTEPPTNEAMQAVNRLNKTGFGIKSSRFSAVVLSPQQLTRLVEVASRTGATIPESLLIASTRVVRAFCIQTRPHVIDRIVIMHSNGRSDEIVWYAFTAGFCSLLGLRPNKPRLLAADIETALKLQHDLSATSLPEEVACLHLDLQRGDACPRWDIQEHLFTAVPRHCDANSSPEYFGANDIVRIQNALDQFPGVERSIRSLTIDHVMSMKPREHSVPWASLRFAMIEAMIPRGVTQVPPAAASIFEQTGSKAEDAMALIDQFSRQGRMQLVEDVELLSLTRLISRDKASTVKETAGDYRLVKGSENLLLANFSLRITSNVVFKNHQADRYCQAQLRCGNAVMEVIFSQGMLNDRVQSLEGELQRQLTVAELVTSAGKMPTVIDVGKFRQFVIPHLRSQAAKAKPIRGVDMLGWSDNRKSFMFPGFVATAGGSESASQILCPSVPVLARYKAVPISTWAESCPQNLDVSCHDIIAMLVASSVRYFRRCVTQPIMIAQSSAAMTVLDRISSAMGQKEIHTLNLNTREGGGRVEGVHGYPLLAAGPRAAASAFGSKAPFIHLTDSGYNLATAPSVDQSIAAGRAAQFCLKSVVDWCLRTGGDAFREIPAIMHHRSLLREGRWLIENVCELEDWQISQQEDTAIERLLAQIPYDAAGQRITLIDGQDLHIDIRGLTRDHDAILREARDMGTLVAIEGDKLVSTAVRLLPAISTYYGQEPDVTLVTT